jgi:tetratricopeptide (TPR) repeat protein
MENKNHHSDIYFKYFSLGMYDRVRYFDAQIKDNLYLPYDENFEINIDHAIALFEIGKYEKYLYWVDHLIEKVIEENFYYYKGEDVFQTLLFKKAASHYNLQEYELAEKVLHQLCKINPKESQYRSLLYKCTSKRQISKINHAIIAIVILSSLAIIIKIVDIFLIDTFYNKYHIFVDNIFVSLVLSSALGMIYQGMKYYVLNNKNN